MKIYNLNNRVLALILLFANLFFFSCTKNDDLNRVFEDVKIVGVKLNNVLHYPVYDGDNTIVNLAPGTDLSNVALELIVVNGELENFPEQVKYDVRKPLDVKLTAKNGSHKNGKLQIKSAPLLRNLIVEGLNIPSSDIHFSTNSIIVQVPKNTNLTALKLTLEFLNGELANFENGVSKNYTNAVPFSIKGIDGTSLYNYDLIVTTENVGPALINGLTINGIATDSVQVLANNVIVPFVKGISNFANANVVLQTGFANIVDPTFTGTGLNLMSGSVKVKVTGSDGVQKEFTISRPKLSLLPKLEMPYSAFGFPLNDLITASFSQGNIVIPSYSGEIGRHVYNLSGQRIKFTDNTGLTINHSLRQMASDENGKLLGIGLGVNAGAVNIYKWDNINAEPSLYLSYTQQSLGLTYQPRTAGISISGNLDADAIISIPMATKADVLIFKVTGGVLNTTPQKLTLPAAGTNYFEITPLPVGRSGYIGTWVNSGNYGLFSLNNTFAENFKLSSLYTTANKFITYKGRDYISYTIYQANRGMIMRVIDFTSGDLAAFQNPILDVVMPSNAANGNGTMDTDMAVIDNKLHVIFSCTNIGLRVYQLEP